MDTIDISDDKNPHETRDQFAKLMLGTIVGFVASKLTQNLYEAVVENRHKETAEIQQ